MKNTGTKLFQLGEKLTIGHRYLLLSQYPKNSISKEILDHQCKSLVLTFIYGRNLFL